LTPVIELAPFQGTGTEFTYNADHSCFSHANRGLVNPAWTVQPRIERVERSGELARILAESRRVGPGGEHVAPRDVTAALERPSESMFV